MYIRKTLQIGIVTIIAVFLLIQLVPYGHNHTDPPVQAEPNWNSPDTRALVKTACFDCHSNETNWGRWYESVAPASWLVEHDVDEGRQRLNFSEWNQGGKPREIDDLWEVIRYGAMPPSQYQLLHPEAKLSSAETSQLIAGLQATVRS